ncbi:MAG: hypothetical protein EZS26_002238 [Candidatus Ordinivivax streblomastigis]|uniref:PIN domain-containing protein n=1 Tax=Candidatus Ordinivivax streblomastigis TaxID=2540710 RepID=A0A5M8NZQ9_9BACT|nr:MAG: hypothetical protein EZS26_002238 [Candidatus Ordinivivax streblomastigis]
MKIVLDTNCLLMSISKHSDFFWLWQAFRDNKITLCYTTEILYEYYEILSQFYSIPVAENIIKEIISASNSEPVTVFYNWQLITSDPDDNKFVDCAISANVHYLVTNDRHFNVLKEIHFPQVNTLTLAEFQSQI